VAIRRSTSRDLAQIAIFAALIAALGAPGTIKVGTAGVPITFQTLGVMLAGAILGARKGFLAVLTFEVLTFAGLPLLAGGRGGVIYFTTSPSAGFLWGWLAGAALVGALTARILPRYPLWLGILATAAGGMLVIYAVGIPMLAHNAHLSLGAATAANAWFLVGDSVKVILTALVAKRVHRAYPGLISTTNIPVTVSGAPALRTADDREGNKPIG
jgi:biotin transport system substrate-specific component